MTYESVQEAMGRCPTPCPSKNSIYTSNRMQTVQEHAHQHAVATKTSIISVQKHAAAEDGSCSQRNGWKCRAQLRELKPTSRPKPADAGHHNARKLVNSLLPDGAQREHRSRGVAGLSSAFQPRGASSDVGVWRKFSTLLEACKGHICDTTWTL